MPSQGLLSGLRILDLSIWRPGPYATQLLADIGADVLKVEPPGGDPMRQYPELFESLHANKRSIVLDLKDQTDRQRALELAAEADVVIEGFRPGVAERLGVGYDEVRGLNPSVIYCSISGLGQTGPLAQAPGHDINYLAWSGVLSPEGKPPAIPAVPVADLAGGLAGAFGICAAALRRERTGEGERLDIAMTDVLATWTGAARPHALDADPDARAVPGYGVFATLDDRRITLGVLTEDHFWQGLCDVLGLAGSRHLQFAARMESADELQHGVAEAIAGRPRDGLVASLLAAGVPAAPVLDRTEMLALPHLRERAVVTGPKPAMGYPITLHDHAVLGPGPAPKLDQHHGAGFRPRG